MFTDEWLALFIFFFKIGIFCFGGGYTMISLLSEAVVSEGLLTQGAFTDIVAISQITPGPIAVNLATFVGFGQAGIGGALFATAGVCAPSFVLVLTALRYWERFQDTRFVNDLFSGLRPVVLGLILAVCVQFALAEFFPSVQTFAFTADIWRALEVKPMLLSAAAFTLIWRWKGSPVYVILAAAILGILIF